MFSLVVFIALGLTLFCMFIGCAVGWSKGGLKTPLYTIDDFRLQMKRAGLVLHMPSYHNGTEGYIEEQWKDNPYILLDHLKRF